MKGVASGRDLCIGTKKKHCAPNCEFCAGVVGPVGLNRNYGWSEAPESWDSFVDAEYADQPRQIRIHFDLAALYQASELLNILSYIQSPWRLLREVVSFEGQRQVQILPLYFHNCLKESEKMGPNVAIPPEPNTKSQM